MANNQYPNPDKPYSLTDIAKKIRAEPDYAKFIYDQICQARTDGPNSAAAQTVNANFQPLSAELAQLGIPATMQPNYALCTDPKTRLLLFAC